MAKAKKLFGNVGKNIKSSAPTIKQGLKSNEEKALVCFLTREDWAKFKTLSAVFDENMKDMLRDVALKFISDNKNKLNG